jgi:small nuclear ribonucleoprotein (snRNP)-like protein
MKMNQDLKLGFGAGGKEGKVLAISRSELRLGVLGKDMLQDLKLGLGIWWGRKGRVVFLALGAVSSCFSRSILRREMAEEGGTMQRISEEINTGEQCHASLDAQKHDLLSTHEQDSLITQQQQQQQETLPQEGREKEKEEDVAKAVEEHPKPLVKKARKLLYRRLRVGVEDGRVFVGRFHCLDKQGNIILYDTLELRYVPGPSGAALNEPPPVEQRSLGLVLIPSRCRTSCSVECSIHEQMDLLSLDQS